MKDNTFNLSINKVVLIERILLQYTIIEEFDIFNGYFKILIVIILFNLL